LEEIHKPLEMAILASIIILINMVSKCIVHIEAKDLACPCAWKPAMVWLWYVAAKGANVGRIISPRFASTYFVTE
jgi:hypothetical protein